MKVFLILAAIVVIPCISHAEPKQKKERFRNAPVQKFIFPDEMLRLVEAAKPCKGPDGLNGICESLSNCEPFKARLLADPTSAILRNEIKESNKICSDKYAVVCCPNQNNDIPVKLPTVKDGCGYKQSLDRNYLKVNVVGGRSSVLGTWPWIALLGYNDGISTSPFKCGGTLITRRHVLTAAHCIKSSLSFVRLGEHDLSRDTEARHIDVPVSKVLKHPKYNRLDGHSDIAILLLDAYARPSGKIGPICLPLTKALQKKSFVNQKPFVAGWGRTLEGGKTADVLQELQLIVFNNSVCKDLYERQNKIVSKQQFNNAVMCAGDLAGGKDTCQGDSGGPLMITESYESTPRFHLIGVVSYGIGCARPDTPGVYTRVAHFMDWIQDTLKTLRL